MTSYTYSGPLSAVTLKLAEGGEREVQLVNGKEVSLPAEHPFVRKLRLKGRLTEVITKSPSDPLPAVKSERQKTSEKEALNAG